MNSSNGDCTDRFHVFDEPRLLGRKGTTGPCYIVEKHNDHVILTDKHFSHFWKAPLKDEGRNNDPARAIWETALSSTESFFDCMATCNHSISTAQTVIYGIPFAKGSLKPSTGVGLFPKAFRSYSQDYPVYAHLDGQQSSGLYDTSQQRVLFEGSRIFDAGDLSSKYLGTLNDIEAIFQQVFEWSLPQRASSLVIGGDHSITYALVKALSYLRSPIFLIQLDAHSDCGLNKFNDQSITHANFVDHLLRADCICAVLQIGLRGFQSLCRMVTNDKIFQIPGNNATPFSVRLALERIKKAFPDAVGYLSIDLDCIDPSQFPLVDYPSPGGLEVRSVLEILNTIFQFYKPIIAVDIVEGSSQTLEQTKYGYQAALAILAHCLDSLAKHKPNLNRISLEYE
ncbi:arginase family protein [Candidatus Acetothermia bacterium]|nr:arginase family protein [Candidatus Acetothermia bacterium]